MKNLKLAFLMNRDKFTESMKPLLLGVLARTVYFPDGKTLLEKWNSEIQESMRIKHTMEDVTHENNVFKWSCTSFGNAKFQLSGRFRPNLPTEYKLIGDTEVSKVITITKQFEDGTTETEDVPYGGTSVIHQYKFVIPLPTKFAEDKVMNLYTASVNITEGNESTFLAKNTIHSIIPEVSNGNLFIYVNHYCDYDDADFSDLAWISGDFSIMVDGIYELPII